MSVSGMSPVTSFSLARTIAVSDKQNDCDNLLVLFDYRLDFKLIITQFVIHHRAKRRSFVMWFDDTQVYNEKTSEALEFYSGQFVQAPYGHVHRKVVIQHRPP
jgi:hypothetical protein